MAPDGGGGQANGQQPLQNLHLTPRDLFIELYSMLAQQMFHHRCCIFLVVMMAVVVLILGFNGGCSAEITSLKQINKENHGEISQLMNQSAVWRRKVIDLQEENTFQFMEIGSLKKKIEELVQKNTELQTTSSECAQEREQFHRELYHVRYHYYQCNKELKGEGKLFGVRITMPLGLNVGASIPNPFSSQDDEPQRIGWEMNPMIR